MLKKLSKVGEYTHTFIILGIITLMYITPAIDFNYSISIPEIASFGKWISGTVSGFSVMPFINLILIVSLAVYINYLGLQSDILPRRSYLTATVFVLLMIFSATSHMLATSLVLCLLLTYSLGNMLNMFGRHNPSIQVLNASMAISVSAMIMPQAVIFVIFLLLGFLTYSINTWREWVISLIGLVMPWLYLLFAWFWNDNLDSLWIMINEFTKGIIPIYSMPSVWQIIVIGILLVIFTISNLYFINDASDKIISIRKRIWITYQFGFISLIALLASGDMYYLWLPVVFIPNTIMITYYIHDHKKSRIFDILFILFLVSAFYTRIAL